MVGAGRSIGASVSVSESLLSTIRLSSKGFSNLSPKEMSEHAETKLLFKEEIDSRMEPFANYERIKKIHVCHRLFELDRGEITPKLSIKRKVVSENFKDQIDVMYNES